MPERMERPRVLVVDDEELVCCTLHDALTAFGYEVTIARNGPEALELVGRHLFDAALLDIRLSGMDGVELLRRIKQHDAAIEVVMITGYPEVGTAVQALRLGAYDYLEKPIALDRLREIMAHTIERRAQRLAARPSTLPDRVQPPAKGLVVASPQMQRVKDMVDSVAATDSPVLIEGESGTGKELLAAAIHSQSSRSRGPFIAVNCGAIPSELLESELFGHVRGAFSGAVADAVGLFRSAAAGTLFLDEVAELPRATQVKLLRFLQDKEIRPVGSTRTYTVDVRIIAATNRNLEEAIRGGAIREDLFYRLNVVRISVPPLRERKESIPTLVCYFLRRFNERFGRKVWGIAPDAMAALMAYHFPGNVRELENMVERAYALGAGNEITLADLPPLGAILPGARTDRVLPTIAEAERELILRALQLCGNEKERAARALGISRRTFYRRLKDYGLL